LLSYAFILIISMILQVTCNSKSSFLAAADDSGEVKVCFVFIHVACSIFTLCNIPHLLAYMNISLKAIHELAPNAIV
jgi:hypothetical protein